MDLPLNPITPTEATKLPLASSLNLVDVVGVNRSGDPQFVRVPQQLVQQGQLTGNGNPNNNGIVGTLGATYQDTLNGALYVYAESSGPYQWLPVLTDQNAAPGSSDGQIFTNDGGYNVWAYGVNNAFGEVMGWSSVGGLFANSFQDSNMSADFDTRTLKSQGVSTINWTEGLYAIDTNSIGIMTCDQYIRLLHDLNGSTSIDLANHTLKISDITTLNYGTSELVAGDYANCYWGAGDGIRLLGGKADGDYPATSPKLAFSSAPNAGQPIAAFETQYFTPAENASVNTGRTPANDILIVLDPAAARSVVNLNISATITNLLGGAGTEARIQIFSTKAIATLNLTTGYTLVGAAISSIAANGQHTLRLSSASGSTKVYHVA